jgi:hypothetical protein
MQSSGNISCQPFDQLRSTKVVKGAYTCKAASNDVQSTTGGSSTSSSSSASGTAKSVANSFTVSASAVVGVTALVGAMVQLL